MGTGNMKFSVGDKVLLHSRGAGTWFPIEEHAITRVTRKGTVFVDGLENVEFKDDGQQTEPSAFHFRFYIEPAPVNKARKKK